MKLKKIESIRKKMGFGGSSKTHFFQYFFKGQILAYFEHQPKDITHLINLVNINQVDRVEENFEQKEDHFAIIFKNSLYWHIKCSNERDRL